MTISAASKRKPSAIWLIPTYGFAALAGYGAALVGLPLPWMLGPFLVFAVLSGFGVQAPLAPHGRELAQVAIGLAIGLRFTPPVVAATVALLPQMIGATLYLLAGTTLAAFLFRKLAGADPVTAFFATAAGGVADMANVAQTFGGAPTSVAVVHALRVSLVVAIAPFVALGAAGRPDRVPVPYDGNTAALIGGLVFAYIVARVLKRTPLPNPWLVGPILGGIMLALAGLEMIMIPAWLITLAQLVLGVWLGCQFKRELLSALPRVTAAGVVTGLFLIAFSLVGAVLLVAMSELTFVTAFLSMAPAAVTEMVLVAKFMGLDAETVAAFHVMRILIVSTSVLWVYRLYLRLGRFSNEP
ncbi:AbrB family transcriptional regulator [Thetidibacter halocola]|uniref:AbrB family transcriptional regulator n=1 Tax=Thetidibacter halocola TaxID=2827239 RepID=A0A8J8B8Q2_9RHOB|nr:AbrB family transcriptional regulator [Thetidibacter halocola]MBS0125014.1 AbrB family transcriptional regulator [Thetidibacter halocola]